MPNDSFPKETKYDPKVPAIDQMMRVLQFLSESSPTQKTLTEICRQTGIHKSRGYALLSTMQKYDLVDRIPGAKTYRLGPGFLPMAKTFLDHLDIRQISQPVLNQLSHMTNSTALLGHINDDSVFIIAVSEGQKELGISLRIGHRFDLTYGAHGKAIAAFTPEPQLQEIIDSKPLYFYGDPDRVDLQRLEQELARCRQEGFAVDFGELQAGITAISAPVAGPGGRLTGCIILVGLFSEEDVKQLGPQVVQSAGRITQSTGGSPLKPAR